MIGIYIIKNLVNNKVYIGQTSNIKKRQAEHKRYLNNKGHHNIYLQNAWNKYGEYNFKFSIIEECTINELNIKEQYWIEYYKSNIRKYGYNMTNGGDGVRGFNFSDEQKQKLSKAHKGQIPVNKGKSRSEETKRKISEKCKGIKLSEEIKEKIRQANLGKVLSKEHKEKIRQSNKGLKRSEETRKRISESKKGIKLSNETKKKLSEANSGKNNGFYGKVHSEETKKLISEKGKGNKNASGHRSEEVKARMKQLALERKMAKK
jgi:group I intron endonuclease